MNAMLVYFNDSGEIQCISPVADPSLEGSLCAEFPREEVIDFITGAKRMYAHFVAKEVKDNVERFSIFEKAKGTSDVKVIDRFLTEVRSIPGNYDLLFEVDTCKCVVRVSLSGTYNQLQNKSVIWNFKQLEFYVTYLGDPNYLIDTIVVDATLLVTQDVFVNYDPGKIDFSVASVYTKKILGKYQYRMF